MTESDLRSRVLSAAVELFAQHGYERTSVAQVVAAAGVAKGGFYHHFASKEDLLYEVYGDLIGRQLAAMDEIAARRDPPDVTLHAMIVELVVSTAGSAKQAKVFWREMHSLGDERAELYRRQRRRCHDAVHRVVREGQTDGTFSPATSADTVTFTIFGVVNEMPIWYRPTGRKRPLQLGEEIAGFLLAGLGVTTSEREHA